MVYVLLVLLGLGAPTKRLVAQSNQDAIGWVPHFLQFDTRKGLPSNHIYEIGTDSRGYLWFCTDHGVSRFDGYGFTNFTISDGVTDSDILGIREDSQGRLWLLTRSGVPCYFQNEKFHNPKTDPYLNKIKAQGYTSAWYQDKLGNIWLGFYDGGIYMIAPDNAVKEFKFSGVSRILGFGESEKEGLFVLQNIYKVKSISDFDRPWKRVYTLDSVSISAYPVKNLSLDDGQILTSWGNSIRLLNHDLEPKFYEEVIPAGKILGLFPGTEHRVYVATTAGAYSADVRDLSKPFKKIYGGGLVYAVYEDPENGLWFGTDRGAFLMPKIASEYLNLPTEFGVISAMAGMRDQSLAIGSKLGHLLVLDGDGLVQIRKNIQVHIKFMRAFQGKEIWMRTSGGIFRLKENQAQKIQNFSPRDFAFSQVDASELAMCISTGTRVVDPARAQEEFFGDSILHYPTGRVEVQCYCVNYDTVGNLLSATSEGVSWIHGSERTKLPKIDSLVGYSVVTAALPSREGTSWLGTNGNGLIFWNDREAQQITSEQGLADNFITAITPDPTGGVWVGTSKGLNFINITHDPSGKSSIEIQTSAWFINVPVQSIVIAGNKLIVSTTQEILRFDKTQLLVYKSQLRPQIEYGIHDGQLIASDSLLKMAYEKNSLEIHFVAISYLAAANIQYRYRLLGLAEEWSESREQFVKYEALPPGEYEFELQARILGANWNDKIAKMQIVISPAFYQTWWFRLGLGLMGLMLVAGIFYLVYLGQQRRNALMYRANEAEQKALITQMNPHFIFNSLNSIQYFYLTNELEIANEYLADFGLLIRLILENGRKARITVAEEIQVLELYMKLEQLRLRDKFNFSFEFGDLQTELMVVPPMIVQPIAENAIWHGLARKEGTGNLEISFSVVGECLLIEIDDDGIGRAKAAEIQSDNGARHKSLATSITLERLEILKRSFPDKVNLEILDKFDQMQNPSGTKVRITLPLEQITKSTQSV